MSYSDPRAYIYQDTVETDFAAGTGTAWSFKGPSGKQGSLKNIGVHVTETFNNQDDTDCVIIEALPADTQIEVTYVQATDTGTAAGKGNAYVEVEWY